VKKISIQIKKLRRDFPYTQAEMAEKVNLSLGAYKNIENGVTRLDMERLEQICKVLKINITELINSAKGQHTSQILTSEQTIQANELQSQDLDATTSLYEKMLSQKDEIIHAKDILIASLKNEISLLKKGD
jgi:transcriptional regulator with XRE-family HTH domain